MNFAKFPRTPFLAEQLWWWLLTPLPKSNFLSNLQNQMLMIVDVKKGIVTAQKLPSRHKTQIERT